MRFSSLLKTVPVICSLFVLAPTGNADVSSVPMGYLAVKIAAGSTDAPVTTSFAIPLIDEARNEGVTTARIASVTADQIKVTGAGWTPGKLAARRAPYAVRIKSGTKAGVTFVITDNTEDTLTVETSTRLTKLGLKTGETGNLIQLIPIDTLDSLFGNDTLIGARKARNADIVYLGAHNQTGYFYNTSLDHWVSTDGSTKDRGRTPIPPESAVSIARVGPATTLFFDGRVPETAFVVDVANSGETYTHTGFPVNTTLGELALQTKLPNWIAAGKPAKADKIAVASGKSWVTYYFNGKQWRRTNGSTINRDGAMIKAGVPIRIIRVGDATGTTPLKLRRPYPLD